MHFPILTAILLVPLAGAGLVLLLRREYETEARATSLLATVVALGLSVQMWAGFPTGDPGMQFKETREWIPSMGVQYALGVDGVAMPLVALTCLLGPLVVLVSWKSVKTRVKEFHVAVLVLQSAMVGVFVARDLFLFYVFWEAMLVPMYLLIGVWGGDRRVYAAVKFFVYTMVGSLLMLIAILVVYWKAGQTFDVEAITRTLADFLADKPGLQKWLFGAFALAFLIKVPMFPFHTWLPDAHTEAPTAGSVVLAGVMLKMGTFGFLRYAIPWFPMALEAFWWLLAALSIIGIVYGALMCLAQDDVKKLIAYSSVSHMGFVMLGILAMNEEAVQGAVLQMLNHGLSTGALFLLIGMIYERTHTRHIEDYGGLAKIAPRYATLFVIVTLSSIGLPGLNGFVGEFLILLGTFRAEPWLGAVAGLGVVLGATYMLWLVQKVFFGPMKVRHAEHVTDLDAREVGLLVPVVLLMVAIGVGPGFVLSKTDASVKAIVQGYERAPK
ncbi:MAG: NADH-quinone oxidoreductase subunit M [Planctomycetota bacterium]